MILEACFYAALATGSFLAAPPVDFSGLPTVDKPSIVTVSADVRFRLANRQETVTELVLYKNTSTSPLDAVLTIPRFRQGGSSQGSPSFQVVATWQRETLGLMPPLNDDTSVANLVSSPMTGRVHLDAGATGALRVTYSVAYGRPGYDEGQSVVEFQLPVSRPGSQDSVTQLNISFAYTQKAVLGLPTLLPDWQWQSGRLGASVRLANFAFAGQLVKASFYNGDFKGSG